MLDGLAAWLFDPSGLTAHGFCLLWEPGLIWTHALSDITIGVAYFTIPLALTIVARRRSDLVFRPLFWLFAAFILLCGTTHWFGLLTLWVPVYWLEGVIKAATALVSIVTAVALWRLLPQALALPSPAQFRAADEALRASEARYRASFERSPVPLHTLDADFTITGVSDSWLALLGYGRNEVIGRPVRDFWPPDLDGWTQADVAALTQDGEIRDRERRYLRRDGAEVEVLVSARLEREGAASGIVCVLIDITARRRAEAALRASEERLRQSQKMEAVGQLTGGIAHDFNNMLQGISGSLEVMERRIDQGRPTDALRYVGAARQAVERATRLTHRMLAFARRQALQPTSVVPAQLVQDMAELLRRTMGPEIGIALRPNDDTWNARCDENQLESALLNLAINARDAMPEGGMLTITTANRHLTTADLSDQDEAAPGDYVEITVSDTGTGMRPDALARAFEPFYTTKPIGKGTGLGLSQVYGFVRQSGGVVRLESRLNHGTIVRLYLPRTVQEMFGLPMSADGAAQAASDGQSAFATAAVLVVEDEAVIRANIAEVLRELGCQVQEAEDGVAGLRIVQSAGRIDVLVTDVGLPGMNGRQLADAARERRPGLPVLLITGYAGTALDDMELAPGMAILRKPFTLDELADRLRAILDACPRPEPGA